MHLPTLCKIWQCSDLLKTYGQTLSQIADERAKLNEKILKAEEETKSLEAELKSIRENSVNYDLALKNLAAKTSMYDGLRSAVHELAVSLNSQKIMPACDFDGVLSQISELLEKADAEIFSAKILDYAIVGQNGYKKSPSSTKRDERQTVPRYHPHSAS